MHPSNDRTTPPGKALFDDWYHRASRQQWIEEPAKTGISGTVPLPNVLHAELLALADSLDDRGSLLFPAQTPRRKRELPLINQSTFRRMVWLPAVESVGLPGLLVKDLRAYAASALVDAGGTELEAQTLLRHSQMATTREFYTRARDAQMADRDRVKLPAEMTGAALQQRLDWLFTRWLGKSPDTERRLVGGVDEEAPVVETIRVSVRDVGKAEGSGGVGALGLPGGRRLGSAAPLCNLDADA